MASYMRELELSPDKIPVKYRLRGRVGRGGRVVMDRIPIYHDSEPAELHNYFLPTQLSSLPGQLTHQRAAELLSHVNSTDQLVLSLRPAGCDASTIHSIRDLTYDQRDEIDCLYSSLSSFASYPLLFPPERTAISSIVTPEERDIYTNSDSEDEVVDIHHAGVIDISFTFSHLL